MDRRFLFTNPIDSNFKLTKSASFSELSSTSKKVIIQQQFQSDTHGNLQKQYSCEEIYDHKSKESQLKFSEVYMSNNGELKNVWETKVPAYVPSEHLNWPRNSNEKTESIKSVSIPNGNLALANKFSSGKSILSSPKLIINKNSFESPNIGEKNQNIPAPEDDHLDFQFKKPLLPIKKFSVKKEKSNENSNTTASNPNQEFTEETKSVSDSDFIAETTELKKKLRSLVQLEPKQSSKICPSWSIAFFILVPIAILYLGYILNDVHNSKLCNPSFKFDGISAELKNKIYNQDLAINILTTHLDNRNNKNSFDILALVGKTGVGKSYAAEIIKNGVKHNDNILEFFPPLYKNENRAYTSLSACRCNLIRLENLKTDDISDAVKFVSNLKKKSGNYCVLVLAIFNTQETSFELKKNLDLERSISMIQKQFKDHDLQATMIGFSPMEKDALIKCIKDAADYNDLKLSMDDTEYVMRDLIASDSGCKGAYAKVQIVGSIKNQPTQGRIR